MATASTARASADRTSEVVPEWFANLTAGAAAGAVSRMIIAPLDVVKIRQQIQHTRSRSAPGGSATYRNLGHAFVRIWREEGLRGFWKGNMAAQAMVIPYCALSFGSYETSKRQLQAWLDDTSPPESSLPALESSRLESTGLLRTAGRALKDAAPISAMAGFTSAACSTVLTYPLDLLRTRFAAQRMGRPAYTSLGQAFRSILRAEGPSGLYRGLWPTLLGVMPYMGAQFAAFESLMAMHAQLGPRLTPSDSQDTGGDGWQGVSASGVSGFMAGIFAKTVNMPFDLVRKRIQVMHFCPTAVPAEIAWWNPAQPLANAGTTDTSKHVPGFLRMAGHIVRTEGPRALFRGLPAACLKAGPNSAIIFVVYHEVLKLFPRAPPAGSGEDHGLP